MRRQAPVFGSSSSPSYPMMASMDGARAGWSKCGTYTAGRRADCGSAGGVPGPPEKKTWRWIPPSGAERPRRVWCEGGAGGQGVYPEMADVGHVVFILPGDGQWGGRV